jgi:aminoglycoside phosphotransferase (APT) family kinase protein
MSGDPTAAIAAAVSRSFPEWSDVALEPLPGGITNRNAVVSVPALSPRRFVARLPGERTELLGIDRAHEAEAATRAAALDIGPPVQGELLGVGTLVTELVPGFHLEGGGFLARLDEVVELIVRFHRSGSLVGDFPIHRVVEWHARDAVAHGAALPPAYAPLLSLSARIEAAFSVSPDDAVPCHNDLLPGNVLFGDDRAWLLDFEYAGMNDRYFDLANLSVNCGLDAAADERLLTLYDGEVTPRNSARLALMKLMSEFREGMWAVVQQVISTLDTDFEAYAHSRLTGAISVAESIDVEGALTAASLAR